MITPPTPPASSDGSAQQIAGDAAVGTSVAMIPSDPITNTVVGLTEGGTSTQRLMGAWTHTLRIELDDCRRICKNLSSDLRSTERQLGNVEKENAVLSVQVDNGTKQARTNILLVTIGSALIGFSIELFKNNSVGLGVGLLILGIISLVWGWLPPRGSK